MRPIAGAALGLSLALPAVAAAQDEADLIVINAVIYTMDVGVPTAEALAIQGGHVVAVGDTGSIARFRGPGTQVIDAGGKVVLPGLIDAHAHVMGLGRALRILDLVGTESAQEIAQRVRETAASQPAGDWITGRGWDQNDWEAKEFPEKTLLDAAAPDHPVLLSRIDGHAVWVNSQGLEAAGVTAETPDPPGGRIVRDESGQPTGILVDNAMALVAAVIPVADREEREAQLAAATERMVSVGLTGVHDMGVNESELELYREWAAEGRLDPRVVVYLGADRETLDWWDTTGLATVGRQPSPHLKVAGIKFYADGALGSRGAALLSPYDDDPGNVGLLLTDADTLKATVAQAMQGGRQPAIHAIGDRGNRIALDAIELAERGLASARPPTPCATAGGASETCGGEPPALRPRIEHVQVVALEDIPRFAELGVIASFQPTHATSDMYWAEERVGPDRIRGAYAWRRLRDAGARLACGSDFPVESPNPFFGIYAAVTRQDQGGWPAGGWRSEEQMTREEALSCFTRDAAWAAGMEDEVGTLTPGKRADFVIVDRDPFTVPAEELWKTRVLRTVIDGETVYETGP
ncbi:MAG TPA: amidohydrolase family protein [Gemmatimonadota bacterium]|nr:amidohydrolase family protein [Gemmatimonadota bacterium]